MSLPMPVSVRSYEPGDREALLALWAQVFPDDPPGNAPAIMLTTTDDPREVARCYELGCSVYITKPVDPQRFVDAIQRLGLFLTIVTVPSVED